MSSNFLVLPALGFRVGDEAARDRDKGTLEGFSVSLSLLFSDGDSVGPEVTEAVAEFIALILRCENVLWCCVLGKENKLSKVPSNILSISLLLLSTKVQKT